MRESKKNDLPWPKDLLNQSTGALVLWVESLPTKYKRVITFEFREIKNPNIGF